MDSGRWTVDGAPVDSGRCAGASGQCSVFREDEESSFVIVIVVVVVFVLVFGFEIQLAAGSFRVGAFHSHLPAHTYPSTLTRKHLLDRLTRSPITTTITVPLSRN